MRFVADANIIYSALITPDGFNASLITHPNRNFLIYSTNFLQTELFRHRERLFKKSKLSEEDFLTHYEIITREINYISEVSIREENWMEAEYLISNVDIKDVSYVALGLQLKCKIWTADKIIINALNRKGNNITITSNEIKLNRKLWQKQL